MAPQHPGFLADTTPTCVAHNADLIMRLLADLSRNNRNTDRKGASRLTRPAIIALVEKIIFLLRKISDIIRHYITHCWLSWAVSKEAPCATVGSFHRASPAVGGEADSEGD